VVTVGIEVATNEEIIAVIARAMAVVMAVEVAVSGASTTRDPEVCFSCLYVCLAEVCLFPCVVSCFS